MKTLFMSFGVCFLTFLTLNLTPAWARYEQPGDYVGDPTEVDMNSQDLHEYDNQRDQKKLEKQEQEKRQQENLKNSNQPESKNKNISGFPPSRE